MSTESGLLGVSRQHQLIAIGVLGVVLVVASYVPPIATATYDVTVLGIGLVMVLYAVAVGAYDVLREQD